MTKLNSSGSALLYATYLGGSGNGNAAPSRSQACCDSGAAIAVDAFRHGRISPRNPRPASPAGWSNFGLSGWFCDRLIVDPQIRPSYTLDELLAQCDPEAPITDEDRAWIDLRPVGREL